MSLNDNLNSRNNSDIVKVYIQTARDSTLSVTSATSHAALLQSEKSNTLFSRNEIPLSPRHINRRVTISDYDITITANKTQSTIKLGI